LGLFLFTRTIPPLALLLPYYLVLMKLRLLNTRLAVIFYLIYLSYPLVVWLLKGFFDSFLLAMSIPIGIACVPQEYMQWYRVCYSSCWHRNISLEDQHLGP